MAAAPRVATAATAPRPAMPGKTLIDACRLTATIFQPAFSEACETTASSTLPRVWSNSHVSSSDCPTVPATAKTMAVRATPARPRPAEL
ncbi:MAG: hypothetical protein JWN08_2553 [Frankiales bacterium]|nr:hypothetical protein [Frankiales bacterium]